jgi:hypothetical protein
MGFDINDLMSKDTKVIRDIEKPIKKQGRPKKEVTKKNIISTYLTDSENEDFRKIVEKSELSVSSFLRKLIIEKIENS